MPDDIVATLIMAGIRPTKRRPEQRKMPVSDAGISPWQI
jgi:hypothetical protein